MSRRKRHRLGQNFLVDPGVARAIVSLLADAPPGVVEIGPGHGALTGLLLAQRDRVVALEVDTGLSAQLRSRWPELELIQADALREPLTPLLAEDAPWQLVSNLPYSVGTAILRRLLPRHDLFSRLVVMLQREVAERVVAQPGEKNHALLALERAAFADARLDFDVPPQAFRPRPRVVSSVLVLDLKPPVCDRGTLATGLELAGRALTRPRKTLTNALAGVVSREELEVAGLDLRVRPGTLDLEAWLELARRRG